MKHPVITGALSLLAPLALCCCAASALSEEAAAAGASSPYAVSMEPMVPYSQWDPVYHSRLRELRATTQRRHAAVGAPSTRGAKNRRDAGPYGAGAPPPPPPGYDDYGQPQHEYPEPIIEIIIKESNETLPAPPPPPVLPPKKPTREPVHVFYVKYKQTGSGEYGKDGNSGVVFDDPIPALTPAPPPEEEDEHPHHQHHQHADLEDVTPAPPRQTTTLRAIIHPDSEQAHTAHGSEGKLRVTFGGPHDDEGSARPPQAGADDKHDKQDGHEESESAQQPAVAFPAGAGPSIRFPGDQPEAGGGHQIKRSQQQPAPHLQQTGFNGAPLQGHPPQGPQQGFGQQQQHFQQGRFHQPPPEYPPYRGQNQFGPPPPPLPPGPPRGPPPQHQKPAYLRPQPTLEVLQNPRYPPQFPPQQGPFQEPFRPRHPAPGPTPGPADKPQRPFQPPQEAFRPNYFPQAPSAAAAAGRQPAFAPSAQHPSRPAFQQPTPPAFQQSSQPQPHQVLREQHRQQVLLQQQQQALLRQQQEHQIRGQHQQFAPQQSQFPPHQNQQPQFSPQQTQAQPQFSSQQTQAHFNTQQTQAQPQFSAQQTQAQSHFQPQQPSHQQQDQQQQLYRQEQLRSQQQAALQQQKQQALLQQQQFAQQQQQTQQQFAQQQSQPQQQFVSQQSQSQRQQPQQQQPQQQRETLLGAEIIKSIPQSEEHVLLNQGQGPFGQGQSLPHSHAPQQHRQQQQGLQQQQGQQGPQQHQQHHPQHGQQQQPHHSVQVLGSNDQDGPRVTFSSSTPSYASDNSFVTPSPQPAFSLTPSTTTNNPTPRPPPRPTTAAPSTTTTTEEPEAPSAPTTPEPKIDLTKKLAELPDEVPDDIREQLISSGILGNADIQILDYDKIGDSSIDSLPAHALENFYASGGAQAAGSENRPVVVAPPASLAALAATRPRAPLPEPVDAEPSASDIDEVVQEPPSAPQASNVEMKVVRYDPATAEGQQVADQYLNKDAAVLNDPVVLNDNRYNRYLPLKISGATFPLPDAPLLRGRNVTSVVVLAPVDYDFLQAADDGASGSAGSSDSGRGGRAVEVHGVRFVAGDALKKLVRTPSQENYRLWLQQERQKPLAKQSVILLVTSPTDDAQRDKEIFMYDPTSDEVSRLSGELSTSFVEVAESNALSQDLENVDVDEAAEGDESNEAKGEASSRQEVRVLPPEGFLQRRSDDEAHDGDLDGAASDPVSALFRTSPAAADSAGEADMPQVAISSGYARTVLASS